MSAGYQLHHLRSALRANSERHDKTSRYGSEHTIAMAFQRQRRTHVQTLGVLVLALAVISMTVVAIVHRRFSSHALGIGIFGGGLLALGGGGMFALDRIANARTYLWCSPVGTWLAAIASWRAPMQQKTAVDAAALLPGFAEDLLAQGDDARPAIPHSRDDTPART